MRSDDGRCPPFTIGSRYGAADGKVMRRLVPRAMRQGEGPRIGKGSMELARGIEPPTGGLQNRCSAD
ncbi:protein of unknown function [Candidatus Nitrospira inopinata]|uniref:Uncharacterized protein n=1 Tax=Candidatus Nitrospira inopinata TaxID=1715989 RepID=A0A0S4KRJ4_9BACT|nr:protein of unknown function [Candidatus Nitrospira inopinata]